MAKSKLRRRIQHALERFPWQEYECAEGMDIGKEGGDDLVSDLTDLLQAEIPDLPSDALEQADNRIDQIVKMWHAQSGGRKDSLEQLIVRLQESQQIVLETVVSAEVAKE